MNNELDKYLHTVAHELHGLEAEQREAELREMRGHMEAIVARLVEGGASESEAAEAAIAQFGEARRVGEELRRAGRTSETVWHVVMAGVCAWLCMNIRGIAEMHAAYYVAALVYGPDWQSTGAYVHVTEPPIPYVLMSLIFFLALPFAIGAGTARVAPERAAAGVLLVGTSLSLLFSQIDWLFYLPVLCLGASTRARWGKRSIRFKHA